MYSEEVPLSCKYFTKIRKSKNPARTTSMLLAMHESILQSWVESLLPDREVLSCDPSLGLASSWRQKPCAQMCWAQSIHMCHIQECSFWHWEGFPFSVPVWIAPTGCGGSALCPIQWALHCSWGSDTADGGCAHYSLWEGPFILPRQRNLEEESLLPLLHCRGQRNTVKLQMVMKNIHFSLWVVSRPD